jgi:NAD(P)-dependent dehydrogenase (short-subunit alcohol dehydrogenase family)
VACIACNRGSPDGRPGNWGKIVNAAPRSLVSPDSIFWGRRKFAVVGLTQAAAKELASSGVTVNSYRPPRTRSTPDPNHWRNPMNSVALSGRLAADPQTHAGENHELATF